MLDRESSKQHATNQEPFKSNVLYQSKPHGISLALSPYTYREEIPNPMSNKNFILDNFGHPFLNIHKLWRYPRACMVNDPTGRMAILPLTIACMKII